MVEEATNNERRAPPSLHDYEKQAQQLCTNAVKTMSPILEAHLLSSLGVHWSDVVREKYPWSLLQIISIVIEHGNWILPKDSAKVVKNHSLIVSKFLKVHPAYGNENASVPAKKKHDKPLQCELDVFVNSLNFVIGIFLLLKTE